MDQKQDGIIGNNHGIVNAGKPWISLIEKMSLKYGIPEVLISHQMKTESNFDPNAESPVGAVGLMQIMPATARVIARRHNLPDGPLNNPEINADLGVAYMRELYDFTWRNITTDPKRAYELALIGYFAGPAQISKIAGGQTMTRAEKNYVDSITWDFTKTENWNQIKAPGTMELKKKRFPWATLLMIGGVYLIYKKKK